MSFASVSPPAPLPGAAPPRRAHLPGVVSENLALDKLALRLQVQHPRRAPRLAPVLARHLHHSRGPLPLVGPLLCVDEVDDAGVRVQDRVLGRPPRADAHLNRRRPLLAAGRQAGEEDPDARRALGAVEPRAQLAFAQSGSPRRSVPGPRPPGAAALGGGGSPSCRRRPSAGCSRGSATVSTSWASIRPARPRPRT